MSGMLSFLALLLLVILAVGIVLYLVIEVLFPRHSLCGGTLHLKQCDDQGCIYQCDRCGAVKHVDY